VESEARFALIFAAVVESFVTSVVELGGAFAVGSPSVGSVTSVLLAGAPGALVVFPAGFPSVGCCGGARTGPSPDFELGAELDGAVGSLRQPR